MSRAGRTTRAVWQVIALIVVLLMAAAACGGDDDGDGEEEASGKCPSPAAALTGDDGLPSNFPTPTDVVYTATAKAGPSDITSGYVEGDLDDAYASWKRALDKAPYAVTKSEQEEDDAEVNFESGDISGQVKLEVRCEGRVSVRVTARPA